MSRGLNWLQALAGGQALAGYPASVKVVDAELDGRAARYVAVVPDAANPFPRARDGEVGLLEGWGLGKAVDEVIEADREKRDKRVLVAVVDVPSQAYGRREEALGIHQALAGAVPLRQLLHAFTRAGLRCAGGVGGGGGGCGAV